MPQTPATRIGILIVAYNAASTLAPVLDRIPSNFRARISKVIVSDDSSTDATYLVGLGYQQVTPDLPLTVVRNEKNLGYGGNQKVGYRWAIEHELDVVVLLHGDGQYAPEMLPAMVAPLETGTSDAVFGSRMLEPGAARRGGMPLYKYVGNQVLTKIENAALGTSLSEFHSGYRAYRVDALRRLDFASYSDDFDFDTQIIIDMVDHRMHIQEIAIPTYYGDEICYVNGMRYARQVVQDVLRYRLRAGTAPQREHPADASTPGDDLGALTPGNDPYPFKASPTSSHGRLLSRVSTGESLTVLDLGCGAGLLSERLRAQGHHVTAVDVREPEGVRDRTDRFYAADLGQGLPDEIEGPFDAVMFADVLEHVRHPEILLRDVHRVTGARSTVFVTVPNFAHWYPRARVGLGLFGYDERGILDEDHVRFFTRRTIAHLFAQTGWRVLRTEAIGVPWETLLHAETGVSKALRAAEKLGLLIRPTLCAYQFLFELVPDFVHREQEERILDDPADTGVPATVASAPG